MKVFISWSGDRSKMLAQALYEWIPLVLHYTEPWLSEADIEAGQRWAETVARELETSNFGLVCITRENMDSPWILFEAGALAKSMRGSRVIPLLLDLDYRDVSGPLAQFQMKKTDKSGLADVIASINQVSEQPIADTKVKLLFDGLWDGFNKQIDAIPQRTPTAKQTRSQPEILEELVISVRALDSRLRDDLSGLIRLTREELRADAGIFVREALATVLAAIQDQRPSLPPAPGSPQLAQQYLEQYNKAVELEVGLSKEIFRLRHRERAL